ncbi:hypothetical protein MRX96_058631 [Rhipicephalus microplus]
MRRLVVRPLGPRWARFCPAELVRKQRRELHCEPTWGRRRRRQDSLDIVGTWAVLIVGESLVIEDDEDDCFIVDDSPGVIVDKVVVIPDDCDDCSNTKNSPGVIVGESLVITNDDDDCLLVDDSPGGAIELCLQESFPGDYRP